MPIEIVVGQNDCCVILLIKFVNIRNSAVVFISEIGTVGLIEIATALQERSCQTLVRKMVIPNYVEFSLLFLITKHTGN